MAETARMFGRPYDLENWATDWQNRREECKTLSILNSFLSFQFLKSKRCMQMLLNPVVPKDQWVCSVAQLYLTLCNPTDCSPWGSSVHRIIQARILEWVAISFYRGSSRHRNWTRISSLAGRFFTTAPPCICYCYRFRWNLHVFSRSWMHLEDWNWVYKCPEYVNGIWLQNGTGW